jgi:bisphosphoglycerate-independent phosphoglycerate mutase (AlkP superfamily)
MKNKLYFLLIIWLSIFSFTCAQDLAKSNFTDEFIDKCIIEVFQDKSDVLVFNSTSDRYRVLTDFMKNRVIIEFQPNYKGKGFDSTNELSVFNKYNPTLVRDQFYDVYTFNPLKYINAINFNSPSKNIYRIAETDYIMIVSPPK